MAAAEEGPGEDAMVTGEGAPADDAAEVPAQAEAARRPAQGATSGTPRTTSGGDDVFAQARGLLDQLERGFRARESALDAREAALASREEELAEAKMVFQETVQHAAEQHRGAEAVLAMKTRQLTRLREDTERDVEIANVGLDHHRRKVRALTEKLAEERALLEDREASAAEASTKLRQILVAALAAEKRSAGKLAAAEERHQEELAAATADLKLALDKQDRVVDRPLGRTRPEGNRPRSARRGTEEPGGAAGRSCPARGVRPGRGRCRRGQARREGGGSLGAASGGSRGQETGRGPGADPDVPPPGQKHRNVAPPGRRRPGRRSDADRSTWSPRSGPRTSSTTSWRTTPGSSTACRGSLPGSGSRSKTP